MVASAHANFYDAKKREKEAEFASIFGFGSRERGSDRLKTSKR